MAPVPRALAVLLLPAPARLLLLLLAGLALACLLEAFLPEDGLPLDDLVPADLLDLLPPADLLLDLLDLLLLDFDERVLEAFASDRDPSRALDRLEDPRSLEDPGFLEDPDAFDDPVRREPVLRADARPEPASLHPTRGSR